VYRADHDNWFSPDMLPDVGDAALPSLPPQQPCAHGSVGLNASGSTLDVAVVELRKWLRRYAINAKYPTDPDLDDMGLPLLQFYYRFHEYLYGCSTVRRARPPSPFSNVCRGIYQQKVGSQGYHNLVMGEETWAQPLVLVPLFENRWSVLHDRPFNAFEEDESSSVQSAVDLGDDDDDKNGDGNDGEDGDYDEEDLEEAESPPWRGKGLMFGGKGLFTGHPSASADDASAAGDAEDDVPSNETGVGAGEAAGTAGTQDGAAASVTQDGAQVGAAALVYPLKSTEQEDYTRREHPQFHRQCALFLRRLISRHFPSSVVPPKTRTTAIRNMGAYLCLRMLSQQAEMYSVPVDYKVAGSWTRDLSAEQKKQCRKYMSESLGLKLPGDDKWLQSIMQSGNAYSWKTNLRNSAPEPIFQFANNVLGMDIERSTAPSSYMNQKKQKKQRTTYVL
jgi:hypothetical protein